MNLWITLTDIRLHDNVKPSSMDMDHDKYHNLI